MILCGRALFKRFVDFLPPREIGMPVRQAQRLLRQSLKPDFRPVIEDGEDIKDQ